jgi:hypothetical protein
VAGRAVLDAKVRIAVPVPYAVARRAVEDVQRVPPVCRPAVGPHHRLRLPQE